MDRKFGFSKIKWKIGNYDMLSICERWKVLSPQFCVRGSRYTKWQMVLEKKIVSTSIFFSIKLVDCVYNSSELMGKCELCIGSRSKEFEFHGKCFLKTVELDSKFLRGMDVSHSSLTVQLDIFIRFERDEEDVAPCENESLRQLSDALYNLYQCKSHSDVLLLVGEKNVAELPAHKAILYFRNAKLEKMISSSKCSQYFYFDRFPRHDACRKILRFLYSGCMSHVLDVPMKSVFDVASAYDISPITAYYAPDELVLHTEVIAGHIEATWLIHSTLLKTEHCLVMPELPASMNMTWVIKFFPVSFENTNYAGVVVEFVGGKEKAALVEISLKTNTDDHTKISRNVKAFSKVYQMQNQQLLRDGELLDRNLLENYIKDGFLILGFRARWISSNVFRLPETRLSVEANTVTCKPYCEQANYVRLSEDMSKLYDSGKFQNFGFSIASKQFMVNSAIFSARCLDLYNAVKAYKLADFPLYKPEAVEKLIYFIYCCKNGKSFNADEFISLAVLAETFHLDKLKSLLKSILKFVLLHVDEGSKRQFKELMNESLESL